MNTNAARTTPSEIRDAHAWVTAVSRDGAISRTLHAALDHANAYPRLVAHLIAACRSMERSGNESSALEAQSSRALLRELGELDA